MVCLQVQGNHETIRLGLESTQLELNVMTPIMAANLFESQELLLRGMKMLRERCLRKMKPTEKMKQNLEQSLSFATVLNPYLGYEVVARLVKESFDQKQSLEETLLQHNLLTREEITRLLNPRLVSQPQRVDLRLKESIQTRQAFQTLHGQLHHYSK